VSPLPDLESDLVALSEHDRLRTLTLLDGPSRAHAERDGQVTRSFCSNDYLGLANHPALQAAAATAAQRHGFGASASRLLSGHLPPHLDLEQALARLVRLPAALLFPTGYQANLGVVTSLAGPDDLIVSDQANHASLIDGCRLSRAAIQVYRHLDADSAREALRTPGVFRRRFLITESLFSMDGDAAPLPDLQQLARDNGATLIVDEAHALGVLGPEGRGLCQETGVVPDVLVGTLGKAFGSLGGFAAGAEILRNHLINRSRTFIYTTAPPPPIAAAALAAVQLSLSPEGDRRRATLRHHIRALHTALARLPQPQPLSNQSATTNGPIVPIVIGADQAALALARRLDQRGFFVPAIRPPTVPEGTARLRVTLSAAHTETDVASLAQALAASLP
jgi:8-amino-7-oxononanoate synthase